MIFQSCETVADAKQRECPEIKITVPLFNSK